MNKRQLNEAETRADLIDPLIQEAGWKTGIDKVLVEREARITPGRITPAGRGKSFIADYVLSYAGVQLAVIEAKSEKLPVTEGITQAKEYSKLQTPFAYAMNGRDIYEISHLDNTEGAIDRFPSPEELWNRFIAQKQEAKESLERFGVVAYSDTNREPHYYQKLAVSRALQKFAEGEKRILLTLATGTGKTFIASQIAWKLFKSRWNRQLDNQRPPRILFLADRNVLVDQAYQDFRAFSDDDKVRIEPGEVSRRGGEVPKNGNVFFTIYQTFTAGKEKPYYTQYDPDFFDLVIVDECHRGGANDESEWRGILEYFGGAAQLGLTATPKRDVNVDTYEYFGEPAFVYSLKDGIEDGFLTPYRVQRITSNIDDYAYGEGDKVESGDIDKARTYTESEINEKIAITDREQERVDQLLGFMKRNDKTIVFCANQEHAALIRDLINQASPRMEGDYCVRVTANDGSIGDMQLRRFRDNEKLRPTILTTSQKLTTGVDARNVRNIVLMRPPANMIEFKQIIGRGTRVFEGKTHFTVVDFVGASELFKDPEWDGEPESEDGETDGPEGTCGGGGNGGWTKPEKIYVRLSAERALALRSESETKFITVDGKPLTVQEYVKYLFDELKLSDLLGNAAKLHFDWSKPETRQVLLETLRDAGCHEEDLVQLQQCLEEPECDLLDVLEYVAYATPPISRIARIEQARRRLEHANREGEISDEKQAFIDRMFVNYAEHGIVELKRRNLSKALTAGYGSVEDAATRLEMPLDDIPQLFSDIQKYLYLDTKEPL